MIQPVRNEPTGRKASMAHVFTETSDSGELSAAPSKACRSSQRQAQELFAEDTFQRILRLERKRTERSGKCVLLMLVDAGEVLAANQSGKLPSRIVAAVCSRTRETDFVGWYQGNAIVGVILTEVDKTSGIYLQNLMTAEVSLRLQANLGPNVADNVRISFRFFPEDSGEPNGSGLMDEKIHPEYRERDVTMKVSRMLKRAIDIFVSFLAIIVFSPLFLLISAAVKLTSKGPVLFRQERIGQHGRRFTFLKFRSMKCSSDSLIHQEYIKRFIAGDIAKAQGTTFKITQDPRLTPIGGFLRKCSLDELPQLLNVLNGDMSLVGPRPAIPYEIDFYQMWHRTRFLQAKPGITGLWQVTGRSKTTFDDMVRLDIRYAKQWSLWLDIKILLHTPRAVLSREGAF